MCVCVRLCAFPRQSARGHGSTSRAACSASGRAIERSLAPLCLGATVIQTEKVQCVSRRRGSKVRGSRETREEQKGGGAERGRDAV